MGKGMQLRPASTAAATAGGTALTGQPVNVNYDYDSDESDDGQTVAAMIRAEPATVTSYSTQSGADKSFGVVAAECFARAFESSGTVPEERSRSSLGARGETGECGTGGGNGMF